MSLVLGIDTGGTYTDGVVMDLENQKIITKAKALTTRENLTIGIRNCIKALNFADIKGIKVVSLSTTLATNAIVEGRGCEVGLLLIGHEPIGKLPVRHWAVIKGGHDIKGKPLAHLDLEEARKALEGFKGKVGAVAISGFLSIRNPEHELQLRQLVGEILDVPVVCAHQLTTSLGFHERTVTAALNAKLIPIIAELLESVKKVLAELQLSAPVMIVKGDGSLMSEELAREKPIDTILSGPAASIVGATFITESKEALVLDMGGTTTDIAILRDGMPKVNKEGAVVGGWLTRVQAAEINTYGLGGDSYLQIGKDRKLLFGPQRVWPLAAVAYEHPHLVGELRGLLEYNQELLFAQPTDCFMLLKDKVPGKLTDTEKAVLSLLQAGPHSLFFLAEKLGIDPNLLNLQNLVNLGAVARASVTPTDILHANGTYKQWDATASIVGVQILAEKIGISFTDFLELAMEGIIQDLALAIMQSIVSYEGSPLWIKDNAGARYFIDKILAPKEEDTMDCTARIKIPVVAIGAPVQAYLPQVAEKINAELIIPEHAEVANAIGAATGKVMENVGILIKPGSEGGFIVHAPWERKAYLHLEDAKIYAIEQAKIRAAAIAERAGAADYQLMVHSEDVYISTNASWQDKVYVETRIEVTAIGRPRWDDEVD